MLNELQKRFIIEALKQLRFEVGQSNQVRIAEEIISILSKKEEKPKNK